jgi:hypothetical protein
VALELYVLDSAIAISGTSVIAANKEHATSKVQIADVFNDFIIFLQPPL